MLAVDSVLAHHCLKNRQRLLPPPARASDRHHHRPCQLPLLFHHDPTATIIRSKSTATLADDRPTAALKTPSSL
ncbi:hypothetical protein ACLOJK_004293, partial [Asimina triloba]